MGTVLALFAFVIGGFLLLIAVAGGGFVVNELKIPKVGRRARAVSLLLGIVVITLGLSLGTDPLDSSPTISSPAAAGARTASSPASGAASERHRLTEQVAAASEE